VVLDLATELCRRVSICSVVGGDADVVVVDGGGCGREEVKEDINRKLLVVASAVPPLPNMKDIRDR